MSDDLASDVISAALPGRLVRSYPALLSTEADALAWARAGAPNGSVVVADYQAVPRGRGGLEWRVTPGRDLGMSVVLRPNLAVEREGWLYTVATAALADVCGEGATIAWPDEVRRSGAAPAAVAVHAEPAAHSLAWAVLNVLVPDCEQPRAAFLARLLAAIETRAGWPAEDLLDEHRSKCETLGRRVSARLLPLGPNAALVTGTAVTTLKDGAVVIVTADDRRVAVRPQGVGTIEVD